MKLIRVSPELMDGLGPALAQEVREPASLQYLVVCLLHPFKGAVLGLQFEGKVVQQHSLICVSHQAASYIGRT